jgi:hypothetical protein
LTWCAQMEDVQSHGKSLTFRWPTANITSGKLLSCGLHPCPFRCHGLQDHSKMDCTAIISSECPRNHNITRRCHDKAVATCKKCDRDARELEKRRERDHKLDQQRQAQQQAYAARLAEIEDEIEHQKQRLRDEADEQDRQAALAQKKQDLKSLKTKSGITLDEASPPNPHTNPPVISGSAPSKHKPTSFSKSSAPSDQSSSTSDEANSDEDDQRLYWDKSAAKDDWEEQKAMWGAENDSLDALMSMIGEVSRV